MAANSVGTLRVDLEARVGKLEADMGKAKRAVQKNAQGMSRAMTGVQKSFGAVMSSIKLLAGAAAFGGFTKLIKSTIDLTDSMGEAGMRTGVTAERFSELAFAARFGAVDVKTLEKALIMTSRRASDTAQGTGEAVKAYQALGISVIDASGKLKSSDVLLVEIAAQFARMEDGAGKTALAVALFGRAGAEMIPMLNLGADGLQRYTELAKSFGMVVSNDAAAAAGQLNDNLDLLGFALKGIALQTTQDVIPILQAYSAQLVKSAQESDKTAQSASVLAFALRTLISTGAGVNYVFQAMGKWLGGIAAQMSALATLDFDGFKNLSKILDEDLNKLDQDFTAKIQAIWGNATESLSAQTPAIADKIAAPLMKADEKLNGPAQNIKNKIDEIIKKLIEQNQTFGMSEAELLKYTLAMDGATEAQTKCALGIQEIITAKEREAELLAEGKQLTLEMRDAYQIYGDELKRIEELERAGAISTETWAAAREKAFADLSAATTEAADDTQSMFDGLKNAIEGYSRSAAQAVVDFATEGKSSFKDMADSIIKDLMRMMVQKLLFDQLFGAFGGWLEGIGGSLFGGGSGGKASGGPVRPGSFQEVNERGAEMLNIGNRQFLMMGNQAGRVTPHESFDTGGGLTINVPVTVAQRNPMMQAELRNEIERTVEGVIRRHS